jgi:phosphoglycolate phosphatase
MTPGLDHQRVRAVVFDLDGTLVDTDDLYVRRLAHLLRPLRRLFREHDPTPFSRRVVMTAETPTNLLALLADHLALDEWLAPALREGRQRLAASRAAALTAVPGVRACLEALERLYPLAVLTAREDHSTRAILAHLGLDAHFRAVATARTCRRGKPHPEPFLWIAESLGIEPARCLMVGDTTIDIRAGKAVGAQTAGVLCGFGERRELARAGADVLLTSTADLAELITGEDGPRQDD